VLYVTGHVSISLKDQMNKEWFIFKGTHHLGPFTLAEMEDFYRAREIHAQSLVWREGSEKWESLSKNRDLNYFLTELGVAMPTEFDEIHDLPPPIPTNFLHPEDELPPPIPLDAYLNPKGSKRVFKEIKKTTSKKYSKISLAALATLFVITVSWFFMNEQSSSANIRIKGLMPAYLEKLQEVASMQTTSFAMTMALSMDGKTLFASSNKDGEILTVIKLQSLPKRILGSTDVEILVRGVMRDHLGEYARMQLTKGEQFVPGEYNIEFSGRRIHFLNSNFRFLNGIDFFKKLNTTYTYQTSAIIYSGTPREFEKKLVEYQGALAVEKLKPLTDKLERMQTFGSLLNKSMEEYLKALDKMKAPKEISAYERMFMKDVSPILQSLVVAADELAKNNADSPEDVKMGIASYAEQVLLGKQIGEFASDIITETGKLSAVSAADKRKLKAVFESKYTRIKIQIDGNILKIQDQIKRTSN
jgi:hypothetical protein